MTTATSNDLVPTGRWTVDALHSNANFEVEHAGLSIFRGGFKPIDAKLISSDEGVVLEGAVSLEGISIDDEDIRPHLLSPEFFDAERNPDVTFRSTEVTGAADDLRVVGELSMAGVSKTVEARGTLRGPIVGPTGADHLGLALATTIDRTEYGMDFQMELPGGGMVLANDIKLVVEFEFGRE